MARHCLIVFRSPRRKGIILSEKVGGLAIALTVSKFRLEYFSEAWASTFFSEIKRRTSCPLDFSSCATAIPGKRCPPVPPQAMMMFKGLDTLEKLRMKGWCRCSTAKYKKASLPGIDTASLLRHQTPREQKGPNCCHSTSRPVAGPGACAVIDC